MKLITGGLGFLGSHLARKLVEAGDDVVLFDVIRSSRLVEDIENDVRIVQGNLGNWAEVLDVVRKHKVNCIYHAGALLSASAEESPLAAYMVNANGTFYVLEAARLFNVEKVVFLSTVATYGPGVPEVVNDDTVQIPTTMYGVTKVFCERLGEYYHRKFGVNFRGVRLPSVIGPGRGGGGASAYSSLIVQLPAAGRPYKPYIDEAARMPLLYIKDAVQALVSLGEAAEERLKRRVYNIQGFSPSARDLADIVRRYLPDARIEFEPDPEMVKIVHSWPKALDDRRAHEDWGWQAQYTLDKAVKDFIDEFQARRHRYE